VTETLQLSIVLPAHNEEELIARSVRSWCRAALESGWSWELIVVDDGSEDRTFAQLVHLARELPPLRLVRHLENRGYGGALRSGFAAAAGERVLLSDADLQFDPADMGLLLERAERAELVCGYRDPRVDPVGRRLLGAAWSGLTAGVLALPVRDVNCAFKLVERQALEALDLESDGAFIHAELIAKGQAQGWRILEVPVPHHPRPEGEQSGASPRVVARAARELWSVGGALLRRIKD
jgi:glycosyltransferase involved in cell wall biosynthesis